MGREGLEVRVRLSLLLSPHSELLLLLAHPKGLTCETVAHFSVEFALSLLEDSHTAIAAVAAGPVHDDSVLDIVTAKRGDCDN